LSGGELGILVRLAPAEESEAALALKEAVALQNVIDEPVQLDGAAIDVSLTSGFIVHHDGAEGAGEAIERASIALIQARRRSLKAAAFDAADYGDPTANLMLMAELRRALKEGEVVVHYQPKLDLHSGAFSGAEALVRWRHPTRGLIRPDLFIPMAEETGHIRPLTLWVLDVVADDRRTASAAGYDLRFSVNISGRLLGDEEFARSLESKIGDEIAGLCFEVTETAVIEQPERGLAALERFAASGVEISLDDYGVGLSSLAYLKSIRAHELKIDKSFVLGLGGDPRETLLVRSTINLGHDLGLKVTAEGVEDAETLAALRAMGCDMAQGFFFARAMALDELLNFLNKSSVTFLGDN
jgi:EAL domain-containing protein (putative c-di-GMP-specific phosphodiesterase class I)